MFQKLVKWCQGRHTLFAIFFTIYGSLLAWFGKLDVNFIFLIGAIQSFILGHSVKEDYFAMKNGMQQGSAVTPDPKVDNPDAANSAK